MNILTAYELANQLQLKKLFQTAEDFREHRNHTIHNDKVLIIAKDEPSTRTRVSFEVAMKRLGGEVVYLELNHTTSKAKGESVFDSLRCLSEMGDALVLRLKSKQQIVHIASHSPIPIISAGTGDEHHPTQALTDLYTIWRCRDQGASTQPKNNIDNLEIAFAGDLMHSRTIYDLLVLLNQYDGIKAKFVTNHVADELPWWWHDTNIDRIQKTTVIGFTNLNWGSMDVLYMTRFQKERRRWVFSKKPKNYPQLDEELVERMKPKAMILHPLPRGSELPVRIDEDPRAKYFEQVKNGVYVRMALLDSIFNTGEIL